MSLVGSTLRRLCLFFAAFFIVTLSMEEVMAQVPEIPDPNLPDVAMVVSSPTYGTVILYNPVFCQQMGLACGFVRAHEYAHIALGHSLMLPSAFPNNREAEADCWAAQNSHPDEIFAAVQLFRNGLSSSNWQLYGSPSQRAERIRRCAIQANRWIGE